MCGRESVREVAPALFSLIHRLRFFAFSTVEKSPYRGARPSPQETARDTAWSVTSVTLSRRLQFRSVGDSPDKPGQSTIEAAFAARDTGLLTQDHCPSTSARCRNCGRLHTAGLLLTGCPTNTAGARWTCGGTQRRERVRSSSRRDLLRVQPRLCGGSEMRSTPNVLRVPKQSSSMRMGQWYTTESE